MITIALAGGSSCGKSSIVKELEALGYPVIREIARQVLRERRCFPVRESEHVIRQQIMARRQVAAEAHARRAFAHSSYLFLDRGIGCNPAYCRHLFGFVPPSIQRIVENHEGYDYVFIPDQLPFTRDGLRWEKDEREARAIHERIRESYRSLGYCPVSIPVMPGSAEEGMNKRIDFIFEYLHQMKGGERHVCFRNEEIAEKG